MGVWVLIEVITAWNIRIRRKPGGVRNRACHAAETDAMYVFDASASHTEVLPFSKAIKGEQELSKYVIF